MNNETPMTPKRATLERDFVEFRRCKAARSSRTSTGGKTISAPVAAALAGPCLLIGLVDDSLTGFCYLRPCSIPTRIDRWNPFPDEFHEFRRNNRVEKASAWRYPHSPTIHLMKPSNASLQSDPTISVLLKSPRHHYKLALSVPFDAKSTPRRA